MIVVDLKIPKILKNKKTKLIAKVIHLNSLLLLFQKT